ncbi:unnamed protein product [Phaedon cochleariae]|uniref:MADF domain-containing protein n=1 Tax=Phaedon cochleariae TaxID=80249 RepID=A0A9N9SN54_PHACE|nr:unnamed protein product [Phaedon cochleariae]
MSSDESNLIEMVERFPHIWDKKNARHSDKVAVENAWETIAKIMNFSVEECMETWKSLRLKYVRERRNVKCVPSGSGAYSCTWPLFGKMGFLDRTIISRRTKGNISRKNYENEPSEVWDTMSEMLSQDQEESETSGQLLEEKLEEVAPAILPTPPKKTVLQSSSDIGNLRKERLNKRKKVDVPLESLVATCSSVGQSLNSLLNSEINKEDHH